MNSITSTLPSQAMPLRVRPFIRHIGRISEGTLTLVTPEGYRLEFGDGSPPRVKLELLDWRVLQRIFRNGDIGLAECYRDGLIHSDDLTGLLRLAIRNQAALERAIHGNRLLNLGYRLRHLLRRNSPGGSTRNIEAHYDLGNDFYRLWLDRTMTYSSGRFEHGLNGDLLQAQEAKYRRMLELVGARPGDRLLEIGCGWGGFAEYAARRGVRVHGLTLSRQQLNYARRRIELAGLGERAVFELKDYRRVQGRFDHIISIEMLEAVGERYWQTYFTRLERLLNPGGRVAIQSIVIDDSHFERYRRGTDFIQQYIFPGGMLPSPGKLDQVAGECGFVTGTRERFGADYAETLRRWRGHFEKQLPAVCALGFDHAFVRLWRFYLAYCEAGFDEGRIDVMQLQFQRRGEQS